MAALRFKSHTIQKLVKTGASVDSNGDYHDGVLVPVGDPIACDIVVANGRSNEISFEDGVVNKYQFVVYLPTDCEGFHIGDRVRLNRENRVVDLTVKGFVRYQLQCKLFA